MRKLMWFALGFALAAFAGVYGLSSGGYIWAALIAAVLFGATMALMIKWSKLRLAAVVFLGCALSFCWQAGYDGLYLSAPRQADGWQGSLTVYATEYSQPTDYGNYVEGYVSLHGTYYKVRAHYVDEDTLAPGDTLTGNFTLGSTLRGGSTESARYRADGIFLIAYCAEQVQTEHPASTPWWAYPAQLRHQISGVIDASFAQDPAAFAKALLLGITEDLDYATDTAFKVSGVRHVVAVSGLHVTILFSVIFFLTGRKSWLSALIGIPVLFLFAAVAGFSPSITRACIMHGLMALAMMLRREYDPPSALSFAVLVMLLCNPWVAASVSFQLSTACMVGIYLFAEPIKNWLLDRRRWGQYKGWRKKVLGWIAVSVSISIGATVVTTPLCAYYFGMVSLVSVLTNLLTLWVITFIFYGIMLVCLVGSFLPVAGACLGAVVSVPITYVLHLTRAIAAIPFAAVYTQSLAVVIWLVVSYVLLAVFLIWKKHGAVLACCSTMLLCVALMVSWLLPLRDECRVTALDVGQGQCILIQSKGRNYLVDCGGDSDSGAADRAAAALMSQGIYRLDGLILTHYDADHAGGVSMLLSRVGADALYLPLCLDLAGYGDALQSYNGGTVYGIDTVTTVSFDGAQFTLYPSARGQSDNESGLCILFQTENCDILITGDRGYAGEWELLQQAELPELELLIVGHHGSKYSTSPELLEKTHPETTIISVSRYNTYGHPSKEVLDRLAQIGCTVYRTDEDGDVIFRR